MDIQDKYNPYFNSLTKREFLESSTIRRFYAFNKALGERGTFNSGNLRVSLLDTCNEDCFFCYNEGMEIKKRKISAENLDFILDAAYPFIKNIKLVGGEPLLHPEFDAIVNLCLNYAPTSVTTNGVLIEKHLDVLRKMEQVTVSVHSINNEKYKEIVRVENDNLLKDTLEGMNLLKKSGYNELRINI